MLHEIIGGIQGVELRENYNLIKLSTLRLRSLGDLILVYSEDSLRALLPRLKKNNILYHVLGKGSNQVLPEKNDRVLLKLDFPFNKTTYFSKMREEYDLPCSIPLNILTSHARTYGIKGWEVFTGIPASLGGAVYMNAGTELGEIGEIIKEVSVIGPKGKKRSIIIDQNSFSYRKNNFVKEGEVIVSAKLIHRGYNKKVSKQIKYYLEKRTQTQPLNKFTCGCIFKNISQTCRAGERIDIMGLKGLRFKNIMVSKKHANFFENQGSASAEDVKKLIKHIQYELELNFGFVFETEVQIEY